MAFDVIVVGGGPAGASTAFQLARRGVRVQLLERSRFPRPKPCAECLSPQASRILGDMGALTELEAGAAHLKGMLVRAPNGITARGDYLASPPHGYRGFRDRGLAVRRELLDDVLLRRAQASGVHVDHQAQVTDVLRDTRGRVVGVAVMRPSGAREDLRGALVVAADGLRSVVARRLRLARTLTWPRRIALVAHYRGVGGVSDYVEMHIERDGFAGIADVGNGVTTVAAVFPIRRAREISGNPAEFLHGWLASTPHLAGRFSPATRDGDVVAVGPFASHARRATNPAGGALLVGDAADFYDPFTGEGIYAALRGGEMAADVVIRALGVDARQQASAMKDYELARRREFAGKWRVERLIGMGVAVAPVANRAVRALAANKPLADLLVGVTGDFVPAHRVLRAGYLARLLVLPC